MISRNLESLAMLLVMLMLLLFLLTQLYDLIEKNRKKNIRRFSVRPINRDRKTLGYFTTVFQPLKKDPQQFFIHTRMRPETFIQLFDLCKSKLIKTSLREPLSPEFRLALCLL